MASLTSLVNLPAALFQQDLIKADNHNLFAYIQRKCDFWRSSPDPQRWVNAFNYLTRIKRTEAYSLLGTFPHFIDELPASTFEEKLVTNGASVHYQAIACWLFHWHTGWKDPRLLEPESFEDSSVGLWHLYEVKAKASQLLFEMCGGFSDRYYRATGEDVSAGFLWLLAEASQCRKMLKPAQFEVSMNSVYLQAQKYREAMLSDPEDVRLPWEMSSDDKMFLDDDDISTTDWHLDNYDKIILTACQRLALNDAKFRKAYWTPYWVVYKSMYSKFKKEKYAPVTTNLPPKKRKSTRKRSKSSQVMGFGKSRG